MKTQELHAPFYNPLISYEENLEKGPFGAFADDEEYQFTTAPQHDFLGFKVHQPFGIAAGPLINGKFVTAAFDKGFSLAVYKTVRTAKYPCHPWPNVLPVNTPEKLTAEIGAEGITTKPNYTAPLSITNSFGVPSADPKFWQEDLRKCVLKAKNGQVVIGGFQGTVPTESQNSTKGYIDDFVQAAQLTLETGVPILEANLSCPNEGTGNLLCFDTNRTVEILKNIRQAIGTTPLIIKTAYFSDDKQLTDFVEKVAPYIDAISAINTIPAKVYTDANNHNPALPGDSRLISGICGDSIRWAGLAMTSKLAKIREAKGLNYKIIGVGGVNTPRHYKLYLQAGADAVMCATGAMWNPYLAQEIAET